MNALFELFAAPAWQHLALALLHTLWQGLAIMAVLWLLLRLIPARRPETRYWTAFGGLLGLVLCGLVTWSVLDFDWPTSAANPGDKGTQLATADEQPVAPAVDRPPVPAAGAHAIGRPAWLAGVAAGWLLGVALMMGRMVWMVARLRRFARGREVTDSRIRQLVDQLRSALVVTRSLRIVETAEEFGPAVLGAMRPVLALPVSMMTGLPPEAVRAIIAHELAHIRRHDYLWNLVQMVVEAVLFFNPAVWWLNRQIRIEREACCDALAAGVVGQPLVLAQALSLWAERVHARGVPATAFADTGRHGPRLLLDRVRRMVLPGYRPQVPISPLGLLALLLAGVLALGGSSRGTRALVELAAKILTPAERIERITEAKEAYAPADAAADEGKYHEDRYITISGTVRTFDGQPLPKEKPWFSSVFSRSPRSSCVTGFEIRALKFSIRVPVGRIWVCSQVDGYAPAIVGPLIGKPGHDISDVELVFEPGEALKIHVIDEKRNPVAGAAVGVLPVIDGGSFGGGKRVTDAEGMLIVQVAQADKYHYSFDIRKPGFQPLVARDLAVKPDEGATFTLLRATPVTGVVLSPDGRPAEGAEIRLYVGPYDMDGSNAPVMATTDAEGRFVLNELEDGAAYLLVAEAKTFGRQPVRIQTPVEKPLRIKFGPLLTVSGVIIGDLGGLEKRSGKPVVSYNQRVSLMVGEFSRGTIASDTAVVETIDSQQRFRFEGLLPGEVSVTAGKCSATATMSPSEPNQEVTIDLTRPMPTAAERPTREVVLRFITPDGEVPERGTMQGKIEVFMNLNPQDRQAKRLTVSLEDGVARFQAFASGEISYRPKDLLGYWFDGGQSHVEPGDGPMTISVSVSPAGAIAGQVLNADGTPAIDNVSIGNYGVRVTKRETRTGGFQLPITADDKGRFFITPLPLDVTYTVSATRGYTVQLSAPIQLDAAHPTASVSLQFPPTASVEGTLLDPEGKPLPGVAYGLGFSSPGKQGGHGWGGDMATDGGGRFRLAGLSVGVGHYSLDFNPRRDFRPVRVPLSLDGTPLTVQLHRGLVIEGQVVDEATGKPVKGVELYAMPSNFREGDYLCDAEALTDAEGRFRFSNLDDRSYKIWSRSQAQVKNENDQTWDPGDKSVVLRLTIPEGSPLKSQQKQGPAP